MKDLRSISSIFRKGKNGEYEKSALLYRDILCYPIKVANTDNATTNNGAILENGRNDAKSICFTSWKLTKWLRYNHIIYATRYKENPLDSDHNEIESLQKTTKRNIERLIELELLHEVGKEKIETGTGTTALYSYTVFGRLIAWIVERQNIEDSVVVDRDEYSKRKSITANEIYNVLQEVLMKGYSHTQSTFVVYSTYFEICKNRGFFGNIVNLLKETLSSDDDIITIEDLMHRLWDFNFRNSENSKLFFRMLLWNEVINSLDQRTRDIFLYNVKIDTESKVVEELKNSRGYEKLRFGGTLQQPKILVVFECNCRNCTSYTPAALDVAAYEKRMILANTDPSKLSGLSLSIYKREINNLCFGMHPSILRTKCPACQTDNSLRIPFFS